MQGKFPKSPYPKMEFVAQRIVALICYRRKHQNVLPIDSNDPIPTEKTQET